jgi:hypothetical protein
MVVVMHGHTPHPKWGWYSGSKHGHSATSVEHHNEAKVSGRCYSPTLPAEAKRDIFLQYQVKILINIKMIISYLSSPAAIMPLGYY